MSVDDGICDWCPEPGDYYQALDTTACDDCLHRYLETPQAFSAEEEHMAALREELARLRRGPEDPERDRIFDEVRHRRAANREIDAEEALEAMSLPEMATRTLEERLRERTEPPPFRIENLVRDNQNTVTGALYKTGKTLLSAELARSEVDGVPFLGRFHTRQLDGNVGFWNNEIEDADCDDYFRDLGVRERHRILVKDLKGHRVPLLQDAGAEWAIEWLRKHEIESWILDPWPAICSWSRVNEFFDPEVQPLLDRIDEIKRKVGLSHVHINHQCGAANVLRPRGATSLPAWADSIWGYWKDGDDRYLTVSGRKVGLDEGRVKFNGTGRLEFEEGTQADRSRAKAREQVVAYVEENPGCTTGAAKSAPDAGDNNVCTAAVASAVRRGEIVAVQKGPSKLLYPADGIQVNIDG